jgi:hypothetical protein
MGIHFAFLCAMLFVREFQCIGANLELPGKSVRKNAQE